MNIHHERQRASQHPMQENQFEKIPHNCVIKIKAVYDSLKTAEKKAVDFLLEHPAEIRDLTIIDIAGQAGCSEATIVRLAKRLGYEGFHELKADFAAHIDSQDAFQYDGIAPSDDYGMVVKKVFDATLGAVKDTYDIMDLQEYEKAVNALLDAQKIFFCGVGDAGVMALEAYQRFLRIGVACFVAQDHDTALIMSAQLSKGDVIFAVSYSGRSKTVINTLKRAKKSGATAIVVTNFPMSPLAKSADIILLTAAFSTQPETLEVISKEVTELCILECLYVNYLIKKGKSAFERLTASNHAISINKHE